MILTKKKFKKKIFSTWCKKDIFFFMSTYLLNGKRYSKHLTIIRKSASQSTIMRKKSWGHG